MAPRIWHVEPDEDLNEAFLEAAAILYRLGGAMSVVAHREELSDGSFVPAGATFRWESFSPARRVQEGPPLEVKREELPEFDDEPEPVEIP